MFACLVYVSSFSTIKSLQPIVRMEGTNAGKNVLMGMHGPTQTNTKEQVTEPTWTIVSALFPLQTSKNDPKLLWGSILLATVRIFKGLWQVHAQLSFRLTNQSLWTPKPFRHHKDPGAHTHRGFHCFCIKHSHKLTHANINTELRIHYWDFILSPQCHIIPHKYAGRRATTHIAGTCLSNHIPTSSSAMEEYGG